MSYQKTSIVFRKVGLFLSVDCLIIGASPDAVSDEFTVEIKCPTSDKTFHNYINDSGNIMIKYLYQIQMYLE